MLHHHHLACLLDEALPRELGAGSFAHHHAGTYDELFVAGRHGVRPLLARVRVRSDEASGSTLMRQHQLMNALPAGIAPRSLHVDTRCDLLPVPFRVETFIEGVELRRPDHTAIAGVSRLLARLHRPPPEGIAASEHGKHDDLCGLSEMLPLLAPQRHRHGVIEDVAAAAREAVAQLGASHARAPRTLVHGDVHFGNLLVSHGTCVLVDWEHVAVGDPAVDVATLFWFSALMGVDESPFLEDRRALFLERYLPATGDARLVERLTAYEPLVVALQLASWNAQLTRLRGASAHERLRATEIKRSLSHAIAVVERHGKRWLAGSAEATRPTISQKRKVSR